MRSKLENDNGIMRCYIEHIFEVKVSLKYPLTFNFVTKNLISNEYDDHSNDNSITQGNGAQSLWSCPFTF